MELGAPAAGKIITFYSYKGGTGRSMALANTAWMLAMHGKRVLVMDWDLEAPGVHRYFHPFLSDPHLENSDGILEYLSRLAASAALGPKDTVWRDLPDEYFDERVDLSSYAMPVRFEDFPVGGCLEFIPAGRQDRTYSERLSLFQFVTFYEKLGGARFLEATKRSLRELYDYILVDSRTGVSDSSGICTVQLPDALVICFTLNEQSVRGAAGIAADVRQQRKEDEKEGRFRIYPVPSRVELSEHDRRLVALDRVKRTFNTYLLDLAPEQKDEYWGQMQMVYIPYYALEEIPVLFGNPPNEDISLTASTKRILYYLSGRAIAQDALPLPEPRRRDYLGRFLRKQDDPRAVASHFLDGHPALEVPAKRLLLRFVVVGSEGVPDSVRPIRAEDVGADEIPALEGLRDSGLIEHEGGILRLVPETLVRDWAPLRRWIDEERSYLEWHRNADVAGMRWQRFHRSTEMLLQGSALEEAIHWRDSRGREMPPLLLEFIDRSERADPVRAAERLVEYAGEAKAERFFLSFVSAQEGRRFVSEDEIPSGAGILLQPALEAELIRPIEGGPWTKVTGVGGFQLTSEQLITNWPRMAQWIEHSREFLQRRDQANAMARAWQEDGRNRQRLVRGPALDELLHALQPWVMDLAPEAREFLDACERYDSPRRGDEALRSLDTHQVRNAEILLLRFVRTKPSGGVEPAIAHEEDLTSPERKLLPILMECGIVAREESGLFLTDTTLPLDWKWYRELWQREAGFLEEVTAFEAQSEAWAQARRTALLLDRRQLRRWSRSVGRRAGQVPAALREFVDASTAYARRRTVFAAVGICSVLLASALAYGYWSRKAASRVAGDVNSTERLLAALVNLPFDQQVAYRLNLLANGGTAEQRRDLQKLLDRAEFGVLEMTYRHGGFAIGEFSPDGRQVLVGNSSNGTGDVVSAFSPPPIARIWNTDTGTPASPPMPYPVTNAPGAIEQVEFSPDASFVVVSGRAQRARIWTPAGKLISDLDTGQYGSEIAVSPDSRFVAAGSVTVWDRNGRARVKLPLAHAVTTDLEFDPAGKRLLVATTDDLTLWDLSSGRPAAKMLGNKWVRRAKFTADGRIVAIFNSEFRILDQNLRTVAAISPNEPAIRLSEYDVSSLSMSPDGTLAAFAANQYAYVWSLAAGKKLCGPLSHSGEVGSTAFSPDGTLLATGTKQDLHIWKIATCKEAGPPLETQSQWLISFSPDGKHLLTGADSNTYQGTVKLWRADFSTAAASKSPIPADPKPLLEAWLVKTALRFDTKGNLTARYDNSVALQQVQSK